MGLSPVNSHFSPAEADAGHRSRPDGSLPAHGSTAPKGGTAPDAANGSVGAHFQRGADVLLPAASFPAAAAKVLAKSEPVPRGIIYKRKLD